MSNDFHVDREALRGLTEHEDEYVAQAAKVMYEQRYDEEIKIDHEKTLDQEKSREKTPIQSREASDDEATADDGKTIQVDTEGVSIRITIEVKPKT